MEDASRVEIIPTLKRKIAIIAAIESSNAQGIDACEDRHVEREAEAPQRANVSAKPGVQREPDRQIEDDADDGRGDAGKRAAERLVVAQPFQ